jgi:hypothetical protein
LATLTVDKPSSTAITVEVARARDFIDLTSEHDWEGIIANSPAAPPQSPACGVNDRR